jgi:hypothetical protein
VRGCERPVTGLDENIREDYGHDSKQAELKWDCLLLRIIWRIFAFFTVEAIAMVATVLHETSLKSGRVEPFVLSLWVLIRSPPPAKNRFI